VLRCGSARWRGAPGGYDTPDWSPDKAQTEMEQAITAIGKDGFVGVYAANDGTAGGAIAAMKGQGIGSYLVMETTCAQTASARVAWR
jgi:ABC-type xylose transport system substrate-binding protein